MRILKGGVAHISSAIEDDLRYRGTDIYETHIKGLADLSASALTSRSANTGEWLSVLPRSCDAKSKERYISRFLSNKLICPFKVMSGFIPELVTMQMNNGMTTILMLDQSKITEGFECLMVSLRIGERAIPVAWRVVETNGAIGFDIQKSLLDAVVKMLPKGGSILLAADRFYGTNALVKWCQKNSWQYRIRLKGNLIFEHKGGEITAYDAAKNKIESLTDARFNNSDCITNIGIIWEHSHKEPWLIAMDCRPSKYKTLDYGMRWGIEAMFSDFKSRGFSITTTHLRHADRIERLILVLTIALYWAVSTGMQPKICKTKHTKKNS
jgi:hypothetical protein